MKKHSLLGSIVIVLVAIGAFSLLAMRKSAAPLTGGEAASSETLEGDKSFML